MSWRFARTITWVIRHVLVAALVIVMAFLGTWQLRRLEEKRDLKALVEARQEEPAVPVGDLVPRQAVVGDPAIDEIVQRAVSATGTYLDDDTFVVENRTFNGAAGGWVLTPLQLADGRAVVVNRGFLGFDETGEIVPPPAPEGEVEVEGVLLESQVRGRFGTGDPVRDDRRILARVDLRQVDDLVDAEVLPAYVQLVRSTPEEVPAAEPPEMVALGAPEPMEGPHLSYAVQWFTFTTIAAVGYVVLLRRVARDRARDEAATRADAELDRERAELLGAERR